MSPWTPWWKQTKPEPVLLFCGGCKLTRICSDSLNKSYKRSTKSCTTWDIWNPLRSCENRLNLSAKLATKSLQLDLVTDQEYLRHQIFETPWKGCFKFITLRQNYHDWLENPPWMKMYFLLNIGIFQSHVSGTQKSSLYEVYMGLIFQGPPSQGYHQFAYD